MTKTADVISGLYPGSIPIIKFGFNPSVGTTAEDVWAGGGAYNWLTAAAPLRIAAGGNAADDAAGLGARSVTVEGLLSDWTLATETIDTAGASQSSETSQSFIRCFRAWVEDAGTYTSANTGAITIETNGGTTVASIEAGMGQSEQAIYTVPDGYSLAWFGYSVFVDSSKTCDVRFFQRCRYSFGLRPIGQSGKGT